MRMTSYVLVTGDLVPSGGMDMANLALARYLANRGDQVHIVAHRAAEELTSHPRVVFHRIPKPANSDLLGSPLLRNAGRYWAAKLAKQGARVLVNGGNCNWDDANWIHYVHAAYERLSLIHRRNVRQERKIIPRARVAIVNSERTRRDVVERLGVSSDRVHTVYYGCDSTRFHPRTEEERALAARKLSWPVSQPFVAFVGELADRRKGFDTVFSAWKMLCSDPAWDANLAVIGTGAELPLWRERASARGLASRIRFMGFQSDIAPVLAACSALVAPVRYEAFGLAVQEALCCGLPAFVSRSAGVAERFPPALHHLLLPDPEDAPDLAARLRDWRSRPEIYHHAVSSTARAIRGRSWDHMAAEIAGVMEAGRETRCA